MTFNMDERPVEMQYSTRYLPPALYAPGSHAGNLQSDSMGNFYNMHLDVHTMPRARVY